MASFIAYFHELRKKGRRRHPTQNITHNLWAILTRAVYSNDRQYECMSELKNAIKMHLTRVEKISQRYSFLTSIHFLSSFNE